MYIKCKIEHFKDIYDSLIGEINEEKYYKIGKKIFEDNENKIIKKLDKYLSPTGKIEVNSLEKDWFPEVEADIFLSHSHQDEKKAIILAGFLKENFSIKTFIDSIIWKNSLDLLKKIDDEYNKQLNGSYSYSGSTWAATNVNLILMMALMKMMDKCECAIFLETPNSLQISSSNKKENTGSPWIYSEIEILNRIRKIPLKRPKSIIESIKKHNEDIFNLQFEYNLNFSDFYKINLEIFRKWVSSKNSIEQYEVYASNYKYKNLESLDKLYKILEEKNE